MLKRHESALILVATAVVTALLVGPASIASQASAWAPSLVVLDFSAFPEGPAVVHHATSWNAQSWSKGLGYLRLLSSGASLWVSFQLDETPTVAQLKIVHRSAYAPDCPMSGCAPVTIMINDHTITYDYAPPSPVTVDGWGTDVWSLSGHLREGSNRLRIRTGALCSLYELRRIAIEIPEFVGSDIIAYQFTNSIVEDRPVDRTSTFTPSDPQATLWLQVSERSGGRWIEWRFYDPSGKRYFTTGRTADRYNWGWIQVKGARAAAMPGIWRVDVTIDGALQLRTYFRIEEEIRSKQPPRTNERAP